MTVCYFSGTGYCLYVARRIGGTLLSIPQLIRQESIEIADEAVGIVCPVYNGEMPMMVRAFLKKAHIRAEYFFFVYTYGAGYGESFAHGPTEVFASGDTLQLKDYSKTDWPWYFDGEAKQRRHETVFPDERKQAFRLGADLVK